MVKNNERIRDLLLSLSDIKGWLSINEALFLRKAALLTKNNKSVIVEIGSYQGKSTIALACTNQKVYAIDPHQGKLDKGDVDPTYNNFVQNIINSGFEKKVSVIKKTSRQAVKNWHQPISLLFIDGLHDYQNASFDYENWSKFVMDGGVVAMHDAFCGWDGAGKVAREYIVKNKEYKKIGVVGSIIYGIKGQSLLIDELNKFRCRIFITLANKIYKSEFFNTYRPMQFFLIHRIIKLFLLNHFTLKRL